MRAAVLFGFFCSGSVSYKPAYRLNHFQRRNYLRRRKLQGDERHDSSKTDRKGTSECATIQELSDFALPYDVTRG
jgi:hypothetical protein